MKETDRAPGATIFGCAGPRLTARESGFFRDSAPAGFILFARNCETPEQVRALVGELRDCVGRDWLPILIDQEGGRVARLKPPHWRAAPAAGLFGRLYERDREAARRAAWLNGRLLAADLLALGITVDCVPVLDVPVPGSHDIIGDRAFSGDPRAVAALGRALTDGLEAGGVQPVIKHLPGHGRARADSHHELPRVDAARADLARSDFPPFAALNDAPWGMTAHVVYKSLDAERPATLSPAVIEEIIRGDIGFDGVLMTDDLSMAALSGDFRTRAETALGAGCDLVLHCNGDMEEMTRVAEGAGRISETTAARLDRARRRAGTPDGTDARHAETELNSLLSPVLDA